LCPVSEFFDSIGPMSANVARVTIILRDIPKDVPEQEIRQLFAGDNVVRVNPDIGNTWFVTFGTEEDCLAAYEKCQLKCFRDEPLKARIKSENVVSRYVPADSPSFTPPPPSSAGYPAGAPMPPFPQMMPGVYPTMGPTPSGGVGSFPHVQGRPYPGFMLVPTVPPHVASALNVPAMNSVWWDQGKGKGGRPEADKQPVQGAEPTRRFRKEEIISILTELINTEEGKKRPELPDLPCVATEQIPGLELCRIGDAQHIVEAAVAAADVKAPERSSRGSGRRAHPVSLLS
jgi:hypothetical protein